MNRNQLHSTDISREDFDLPDNNETSKLHLISMVVSFCTGCVIGAVMILLVMKIFVG